MWKRVEDMTLDEVIAEKEHLEEYFEECEEIGQGINTKESIRYQQCQARIAQEISR